MAIKSYILIEKSFLRVLVFGHPYCSSSNSTEFSTGHETTCPFPCHIGSYIPKSRDIHLHVIVREKNSSITFCIKLTIYMYFKYIKNNSYKDLFFTLLLYNTLTAKHDGNALTKKSCNIFYN